VKTLSGRRAAPARLRRDPDLQHAITLVRKQIIGLRRLMSVIASKSAVLQATA